MVVEFIINALKILSLETIGAPKRGSQKKSNSDSIIHRHDIDDNLWNFIKDLIPGNRNDPGRPGEDNRLFIKAPRGFQRAFFLSSAAAAPF